MHRGWVRKWRKTIDSPVWDKPPLYARVWEWLLLKADHNTGKVDATLTQIADGVQWHEQRARRIPNKKTISVILQWLEEAGQVVTEKSGTGNARFTWISICNWGTYNSTQPAKVTQNPRKGNEERTPNKNTQEEQEPVPPKPPTPKKPYQPTPEAVAALKLWTDKRPLPDGVNPDDYRKVLDDMHRLDRVSWNSDTGIDAIVAWAVTEWESKHIQTPSKLRKPSKSYPELKTWQVIQNQIRTRQPEPGVRKPFDLDEVKRNLGKQ